MAPENISAQRLGALFTQTLAEIVAKVSGFSLEPMPGPADAALGDIAGVMSLGGQDGATIFVSSNEADLALFCSYMTGVPQGEITRDDMGDALCEVVNMLAGNMKLILGGAYTFSLTPPYALFGENMAVTTKKRVDVISQTLAGESITLRLKVII